MSWESLELDAKRAAWVAMQKYAKGLKDNCLIDEMRVMTGEQAIGLIQAMLDAYHNKLEAGAGVN